MIHLFHRRRKVIALFFLFLMIFEFTNIPLTMALTSGPSQPEVQGFQPAGTTDMVDLFSGDFSYNIPLFELPGPNGGYPFNLSYQAGIGMDQEASWVGLGFSLNPGAINRQMRGLPDEFKGDPVYTKMSVDPSVTVGLGAGVDVEIFGGDVTLGVGLGVSQNNFKGMGYSIDATVGFEATTSSGMTAGVGLGVGLDSKEGANVNPTLSLDNKFGMTGVGAAYNSKEGLSSISLSHDIGSKSVNIRGVNVGASRKVGATLTLANPAYTPQVSMPMRNINIAAKFKVGGSWWGVTGSGYVNGFYSEQWLKNDKKRVRSNAYGYMNYQHAENSSENDLLDFNREKDGMVTKESPNLAIPSLTYDIYSVTGQGIAAMYRPFRNDNGIIHDPETISTSTGGSVGVDVAPAASHTGVNLSVNHSKSTSGAWVENNDIAGNARFQAKEINDAYEPWYFKTHGEHSSESMDALNNLGGSSPVRVKLNGSGINASASNILENKEGSQVAPNNRTNNRDRKSRSQVIQPITNDQLLKGNEELLTYFKVKYIDHTGAEKKFNRSGLPGHHTGGFTALTPDGLRYNYGIPAYNLSQKEVAFSTDKENDQVSKVIVGTNGKGDPDYEHSHTDKFLKKVELPPYAHSYLLTSIVGPDYVDVTGNGVSKDDLGYWVKFTYKKANADNAPFKWRDPYSQAHYQEGWKTNPADDRGSFVYGEKEIWYLAKAETKSHITTFELQEREDGRGVAQELQDTDETGHPLFGLKEIKLFTRAAGSSHPLKTVRFEYNYTLCQGIANSSTSNGKLTLKKVWFEYGNSQRGNLNPYVFSYQSQNPDYDQYAIDRWGNYKPYPAVDPQHNIDFPYAEQDPSKKEAIDQNVAAWSLTDIRLPSGGNVSIDYESDDYAYVQHLPAMQMTEIVAPETQEEATTFMLDDNNPMVRFKLEKPIEGTLSESQQRAEVIKYLDLKRKQLYFKIKVNLRSQGEGYFEYISGYADIDFGEPMILEQDATGKYVQGSFSLVKEEGHHPFSMRAWQHLRTNQPELANSGRKLKQTTNNKDRVSQIKSLGSVFTQVRQMFEGFYDYCKKKGWGQEIVANKSWVRLNSPDKIKFGGGLRVRQITMNDAWSQDEEGVYGQLYEYTMEEGDDIISSGVAAYEPLTGGDENPHRYAKKYVEARYLRSDNNLFFEYPINESYFPGPQVGYRKVTVTSLAAASLAGKEVKNNLLSDNLPLFPKGEGISYGTTGKTEHEFYTAKEFPVMTNETEKENKPFNLSVPIPFLGHIAVSKLTATQGYSIETNDMHGKARHVRNFRQEKSGEFEDEPISWIKYNYLAKAKIYQQEEVQSLTAIFKDNGDSSLSVADSDDLSNPAVQKHSIGQENEFFMDMREYNDVAWNGGANVNLDILYIPIVFVVVPIPVTTVWPSIGRSEKILRTAVTNKVIFKSGIMESVEAYDGGSSVITQNLKWDKLTGNVLLSQVNNNYDAPVFSYSIPAYSQYQGMGAAFTNIGLTFAISQVESSPHDNLYSFNTAIAAESLFPGDEILLYNNTDLKAPIVKAVYMGEEEGKDLLYSDVGLSLSDYKCMIVRSGYRNQVNTMAGNITALQDPSIKGEAKTYTKRINIPKEN